MKNKLNQKIPAPIAGPNDNNSLRRIETFQRVVAFLRTMVKESGHSPRAKTKPDCRSLKRPGSRQHILKRGALMLCAYLGVAMTGLALETLDIVKPYTPGMAKPIPVAISGFTDDALSVLKFDLYVQGFSFVSPDAAQYVISGSNSGNLRGTVVDQVSKLTKLSRAYADAPLRRQAHAFSAEIVQAITGKEGLSQSKKIAFKVEVSGYSEIYVSDFDGHNAQAVTQDHTIVAAPDWIPGKLALYYTSYKLGNPDIFFQDLSSGQRKPIARFSGLNTAAAASPDGSKVAMILSKSGSPDVYVCNADGSGLKQLTATREDESSPCWSPDGQWICYATKVSDRRSLYKVSVAGGQPQRIATDGVRNPSEPDWSPDGKWIAFTSQMGDFNICVVPASGGIVTVLTSGQDPSWAPNSRTLVFTRSESYRPVLALMDVPTKQIKTAAAISGGNSQPAWAK